MMRNKIIYALTFISACLLVYYEPNFITSVFYHMVVYLMVLNLAHLIYSYITVKISQKVSPTVVEHGDSTDYICTIHNEFSVITSPITAHFLFGATMFSGQLDSKTFSLKGRKKKEFNFNLSCRYRGVYSVGIDHLEIRDFLNVFNLKVRNIESRNITVLPKITPLNNFILTPKAESDLKSVSQISAEGANSLVDVRKFEQGDALKHIHWKLSARHDELLVRNLERSARNSTLIFLDTTRGNYDFEKNMIVEDKLIEALVSVVSQCTHQNHRIEINYNEFNEQSFDLKNREDFMDFFRSISKISFMHKVNIKSKIDSYFDSTFSKQNLWGRDIFIFTCHPELLENQNTMQKLLGNNCSLHIVSSSYSEEKSGAYRTSDGIYYYSLSPKSELDSIFLGSVM